MIRKHLEQKLIRSDKDFRWRGSEVSRVEGFTDAVFAFAVTLLVVSLEVPKNFTDLLTVMKGFPAFAICFTFLMQVWYHHYIYFRRYGLETLYSIVLNAALLFVTLFYVYPLKFIFTMAIGAITGGSSLPRGQLAHMIQDAQVPTLMVVYSLGFAAVSGIFALQYQYAYRKREELELNEYERLRTLHKALDSTAVACTGILVAVVASLITPHYAGITGGIFFLVFPYRWIMGPIQRKKERRALERIKEPEAAAHA